MRVDRSAAMCELGELLRESALHGPRSLPPDRARDVIGDWFVLEPDFASRFWSIGPEALGQWCHEVVGFVKWWNEIAPVGQAIDIEVEAKESRGLYLERLARFRESLAETKHVRRVLGEEWWAGVQREIETLDPEYAFASTEHTLFIGFIQDEWARGRDLIQMLDRACAVLDQVTPKKAILRRKVGRLGKDIANYLGVVFEILVLERLATMEASFELEPPIEGGTAEAGITVGGQRVLVELTGVNPLANRFSAPAGSFRPEVGIELVRRKIVGKAEIQYREATDPVVLFIWVARTKILPGLEDIPGIEAALEDPRCRVFSAIVLVDDYIPTSFRMIPNTGALRPLHSSAATALRSMLADEQSC